MVSVRGDHKVHGDEEVTMKMNSNGSSSSPGMVKVRKQKGMKTTSELASKKHALSERKRRTRINCHYHSLRNFFPRLLKKDKASVLAETVHRLKELKKLVADIALPHDVGERSLFIPGEKDEMSVSHVAGANKTTVRAIVCCEDRPDLNQDLTEAIYSVGGKAVKAEMATIGGRTKAEVVVECGGGREEDVGLLRRALKAVVENRVLGRTGLIGHGAHGNTESDLIWLGFVDNESPKVCDEIENGLSDGLIVRSY